MLTRYKIPKTILWVTNLLVIFLVLFTLYRLSTYIAFGRHTISFGDAVPSLLLGIRYDLRWIAFILFPVILMSMSPRLSPFFPPGIRNGGPGTWRLSHLSFLFFLRLDLAAGHITRLRSMQVP